MENNNISWRPPVDQNKTPKEGMRIRLISMVDDPNPVPPGTEGTIRLIDDTGTIHVNWDNGRTLGVLPNVDKYQLLESSSGASEIKSSIKKTSSSVNKSMPKPTKVSASTQSALKSSGIKTNQVSKNFKSTNIKDVKVESNEIKGGKADNLTVKDLAKKHGVSVKDIEKEIKLGIKIEKEHVGNDISKAREIAMDHVFEFKDFYSNKRYGAIASEKGLKKSEKKNKIKTETTMAAGGASTGAYTGNAWGNGPLTKNKGVAKPGPLITRKIEEATATFNHVGDGNRVSKKYDDTRHEAWADKNSDGWKWNDEALWENGEIVDPLAKIETTWDDENLDISKEWDSSQKKKNLKKEDLLRIVKTRLNESKKKEKYTIVNDKKLDSIKDNFTPPPIEEEELDETTTFGSVWGSNGPPVGPAFAAKKGQWKTAKKPIWPGGTIVQKDTNEGHLNPITEANKVKYNPQGKIVTVKKKCTKFPYCNQGAIDNPINLSNTVKGSGTYVGEGLSDEMIDNIKEVARKTGKPFNEVYRIVMKNLS